MPIDCKFTTTLLEFKSIFGAEILTLFTSQVLVSLLTRKYAEDLFLCAAEFLNMQLSKIESLFGVAAKVQA